MLVLENISFSYSQPIFENISLNLPDASLVCFYGKSGCGKTTLLKLMTFELPLQEGNIYYNDQKMDSSNRDCFLFEHVSYISQEGQFFSNMTIYQHFEFYAKLHNLSVNKTIISQYLNEVNLENIDLKKYPSCLSTGERKRFLIALALMMNKDIMIFDEPTASLDKKNKEILLQVIKRLSKRILMICTSHDEFLKEQADILYKIQDKQILLEKDVHLSETIVQNDKKQSLQKISYFCYKNLKQKIMYIVLLIVTIMTAMLISMSLSENITLNMQISDNHDTSEYRGLIFYKLPDARFLNFEEYDFIQSEDLELIKGIEGVQTVTPYYAIPDWRDGKDKSFHFTSLDGHEKIYSYYWPKQSESLGTDFNIKIVIFSYDPVQHIKVNGQELTGTYINEDFAALIGDEAKNGGTLKLDFNMPVEYIEGTTTISNVEGELKQYQDKREIVPLTLTIDGVLDSDIYSDSFSGSEGNYVKIYMPVDEVRQLLQEHAKNELDIDNRPMTYLLMCNEEQKENVKLEIENANELYRVRYQVGDHSVTYADSLNSSQVIFIIVCIALVGICFLLSYYQLYLRRNEFRILKREGLSQQIKKYYMTDYYILAFIVLILSMIGLYVYYLISGGIFDLLIFSSVWIASTLVFEILVIVAAKVSLAHLKKMVMTYD